VKPDIESHDLPRFADLDAEYEILRELGRGGTAVVYLARERELGRRVAIKVIRATFIEDEEAAARLVREARTIASLQHPNIVMLYGTRHLRDKSLALIMQYVPGRTLKSEIREVGPLPINRIQQILTDLGRALACAQRHRIVHRDIKPENIYLDDETGIARLSDFGIARPWDAEQGLTLPGMSIGTPAYMSPEQIEGGQLDGRSDLYSLGLVGYEMLTGRAPWAGETLFSMIYKQKHEALPPLEQVRLGIPANLCQALEGTLHKNPEDRLSDAEAFLAVLSGRVALPQRRPSIADAPSAYFQNDNVTIQYRRSDLQAPLRDEASVKPAQTITAASPTDRLAQAQPAANRISNLPAAIEISPYHVVQQQLSRKAVVLPDGAELSAEALARPARRRVIVLAAAVPALLLATALVVSNLRGGEDAPPVRTAAAAAASSSTPATGTEPSAQAPTPAPVAGPSLAWAMFGNRQSGLAGDTLPERLGLKVEGPSGGAVAGVTVQFAVTAGEGLVAPETVVTGEDGIASTRWLLRSGGSHTVTATVAGLNQTTEFKAQGLPRPAARIAAVSSTALKGTLGSPLGTPLIVKVSDDRGQPAIGASVQFSVQNGSGQVTPSTAVTGADGTARADWVLGPSGVQEVAAILAALPDARTVFRAAARPASLAIRRGLTVGGTHTCTVNVDGSADCWGGNEKGQLGDGSASRTSGRVSVVASEPFAALSAGVSHTCGVGVSGSVFCWGANAAGQLGDGTRVDRAEPVKLVTEEAFTNVFTGMAHSCGLDAGGRVSCWGQNTHGQLGDGTRTPRDAPVRIRGNRAFRTISMGWTHTCGLAADGTAFCWGGNASGELGDGSTTDRTEPVPVNGVARYTAIAAGSGHTCGLTTSGTVQCWGLNSYGQLGNDGTANSSVPVTVQPTDFFTAITLGSVHSCALARDGSARCWGRNTYGQLGDGSVDNRTRPTNVVGGQRFTTLQANGAHTCGTSGSSTFCWGYNVEGQLGNGNRTNQTRPVAVIRP
jgi:serine/threonine protein kinase/alpha-tubulin suppressor-like RCC1 family protein